MDILFITPAIEAGDGRPEIDVVAPASKALRGLGHKVSLLSPLYRQIDPTARALARRLTKLNVEAGGETVAIELYTGRLPSGVELVFLGHEGLFGAVSRIDEGTPEEVARRVGAFARGAAAYIASREPVAEVVHGFGWLGAAAVAEVRRGEAGDRAPLLLAVVDPRDQGQFDGAAGEQLGLGPSAQHGDGANALKAGLLAADAVTAGSATLARELKDEPHGAGLEEVYKELWNRVHGVLLGVDSAHWNPLTDPQLPSRFDPVERSGKARCKAHLQRALTLPVRDDIPLIGIVGHTAPGRGMDMFTKVAAQVLRNDVQLAVHVDGDGELISDLEDLWDRWPDRIQIRTGSDEDFTHQLLGGCDLLVVPTPVGPTTRLALAAQRYGALPIVHRGSAVADAVVDCDPELSTGTGFWYDEVSEEDLLAVIRRAIAAFTKREAFEGVRGRMMRIDRSLERSARMYERLYRELITSRERPEPGTSVAPPA